MTSETTISEGCGHPVFVSLLTAFVCFFSACAESGAPPSSESETAAPAAAEAEELLVEIDLDEYSILMEARVPAGPVTLRLANLGFEEHNLLFVVLESDSTVWETESRLSPGERRTVELDLVAGEYRAVCDFSGHEDRGMIWNFVVRDSDS